MKKLFLFLLLAFSLTSFSQALEKSTKYKVEVTTADDKTYSFNFYVSSTGQVYQLTSEGKFLTFKEFETISNSNTTTYTWLNNGGVWSENQTFVFTKNIKNGTIYLHYLRVVQNEGEIPWSVIGVGIVEEE
jgi:hypothetical protein